jgi:hypothetical protein
MLKVDLNTIAGGQLQEKFNREITRVMQNMQDPNTPFGDARSITIKINFKQTEQRDDAKVDISVNSKLAGVINCKTNFAMGKNLETGEVVINEYGKQIPGQMSFTDMIRPEGKEERTSKIAQMPRSLKASQEN